MSSTIRCVSISSEESNDTHPHPQLYDVPLEGFKKAKERRQREEEDEGLGSSRKTRKGLFMGLSLGRAGSSRGAYEPISQA